MTKNSIILVVILASFNAGAQVAGQGYMNYLTFDKRFNNAHGEVEGSPFLWEGWASGYIIFHNNKKLEKAELRYNAFDNFLEVKVEEGEYVAEAANYKEFGYEDPVTNKNVVYKNVVLNNKEVLPLEILIENKVIFGLHHQIKIGRGSNSGAGGLNPVKDKFESASTLYLIRNGQATRIIRNKKAILKELDDASGALESFLEEKRLDIKKDAELVQLLAYYASRLK